MNATRASGESGFDAALRALEDLETSVAQAREEKPGPVAIDFSDSSPGGKPAAITAVPVALEEPIVAGRTEPSPETPPAPVPSPAIAIATPAPAMAVPGSAPAVAGAAPVAMPVVEAGFARRATLGKVVVGLALVSSLVSAAGLVIAERTIMSAQLVVADARERQRQLESANLLLRDLRIVHDRQVELLKAQQTQLASTPVTSAELQHRIEALQTGLIARDPLTSVVRAVNESQLNINERFAEIGRKMDRMEAKLGQR